MHCFLLDVRLLCFVLFMDHQSFLPKMHFVNNWWSQPLLTARLSEVRDTACTHTHTRARNCYRRVKEQVVRFSYISRMKMERKHTHTHRESWVVCPLSVLRSIDPAWLLSAGYVSSTAALPVRGGARPVEGVGNKWEVRRGAPDGGRGGECWGGFLKWNGMNHEQPKRSVAAARSHTLQRGQRWNGVVCPKLLCITAPREKVQ